jgi:hypothetical protein
VIGHILTIAMNVVAMMILGVVLYKYFGYIEFWFVMKIDMNFNYYFKYKD